MVHLLLSTAFVLLSAASDPATSLLPRIVQFVETSFAVSKEPKTAQDAIDAIIHLRRTRKLIERNDQSIIDLLI
jgi:hypothetical protein